MVFGFRMASILSLRSRAPCPLRPAAGLLLGVRIGRDDFFSTPLCMIDFENRKKPVPEESCKNARQLPRVYFKTSSTTNVMFLDERLVTRFVRLLQIVQKRTARRHELQEPAARMIVLHVALEMVRQVVDAFRQDRNLNLRRAGVAGF